MAADYHVVTLPNKGKVPVRDYYLRDGKNFSATGLFACASIQLSLFDTLLKA